ncbi:MAG TPA: DUF4019 domain-containing protein [Lysobacter sp.]
MNALPRLTCATVILWAGLAPVAAQQPSTVANRDIDPNTLATAGLHVVQLIDSGRAGEVWDGASAVAKRSVDRRKFTDTIDAQRKPLGPAASRRWTSVSRHSTPGSGPLPAGTYANVEFETRFAGDRPGYELVSFRQDEDGTWRLSGYVLK